MRCYVNGCYSKNKQKSETSYFRAPINPAIRKIWQEFAGVPTNSKNFRICGKHFEEKWIRKHHPKPLLAREAIPTLRHSCTPRKQIGYCANIPIASEGIDKGTEAVNPEEKVRDINPTDNDELQNGDNHTLGIWNTVRARASDIEELNADITPAKESPDRNICTSPTTLSTNETPSIRPSKSGSVLSPKSLRLKTQSRTIAALRSKIHRLQRTNNLRKSRKSAAIKKIIEDSEAYLSKEAHALLTTNLKLSSVPKSARRYSDALKDIALSIWYHSPKSYRFLKKIINLPSERTLRQYQQRCPVRVGINETVLNHLKATFIDAPHKNKLVSLVFDEINLTAEIHYDAHSDYFNGFADDGTLRLPQEAKSALVGMITWIDTRMKQSIGHWFLGKSGNTSKIRDIVETTIQRVSDSGLIVKCLICDQGPGNKGLLKAFGVSVKKPYFDLDGTLEKIFFIFDPPHLLKSMRNNLQKKKLSYLGGHVDWNEILKVFQLSRESQLNLIPKITEAHFSLTNFSKMKVSLAAQVFSQTMFNAYSAYKLIFPEKFATKNDQTPNFILDMDKLFDSLNSTFAKKTVTNKLNYAISNESEHREFLETMISRIQSLRFDGQAPDCIKGFLITINSVLQLADELQSNHELQFLRTRRLCQDPLENLFATIRQQHGCNMYPSPKQFENGMRQIYITHLTKVSNSANCQSDDNFLFAKLSDIQRNILTSHSPHEPVHNASLLTEFDFKTTESELLNETETNEQLQSKDFTEQNAIFYISGFLAKKFLAVHTCDICRHILLQDHADIFQGNALFTSMKEYSNTERLKYVQQQVFETIYKWEKIFQVAIEDIVHYRGISKILQTIITESASTTLKLCSDEATTKFMQLFIRIRCFWHARYLRRKLKGEGSIKPKFNSKMKKFIPM